MALLQAQVPENEKKNFDINTRTIDKTMTEVVRDFIAKFNANPQMVIQFLYPTQP